MCCLASWKRFSARCLSCDQSNCTFFLSPLCRNANVDDCTFFSIVFILFRVILCEPKSEKKIGLRRKRNRLEFKGASRIRIYFVHWVDKLKNKSKFVDFYFKVPHWFHVDFLNWIARECIRWILHSSCVHNTIKVSQLACRILTASLLCGLGWCEQLPQVSSLSVFWGEKIVLTSPGQFKTTFQIIFVSSLSVSRLANRRSMRGAK